MGISGLLPLLKSIHRHAELKQFAGETLGVDGYGWLHRGAIGCAIELAEGKPSRKYVDFAMHRVRMMKHFGVAPYIVFDGDFLPSKAGTEASRAKRREESRKAGLELLRAGKASQAHLELQKAIDVSPEMARHLIEELKKAGVQYVVAPYEADAQLVYLERSGLIAGIISEDSDLLVFGAKRLLTKMDQYGQCVEINRRDFCAVREVSLTGWTDAEFRHMAILNGCDYLKGLENMGLKTAYRMIRKYKTPERVIKMVQFDGKHRVPENYLADFKQADLTFRHQRVFCPKKQDLAFLTEPDASLDIVNMHFLGSPMDVELARSIATGEVNPITKAIIEIRTPGAKRRNSHVTGVTASASQRGTGKPIEAYFQGYQRIPLGEMDPNCFVVKPNQTADSPAAERVIPLPRPYLEDRASTPRPYITPRLSRRRTEPIPSVLSTFDSNSSDQSRRRTTGTSGFGLAFPKSASAASRNTGPVARPSKKPRLCEDQPEDSEHCQTGQRSRFFPLKHDQEVELEKPDSILKSDDSVGEALLSLPDLDGWGPERARTTAKVEIYADSPDQKGNERQADATSKDDEIIPNSDVEIPASPSTEVESARGIPRKGSGGGSPQRSQKFSLRQFSYKTATDSAQPAGNATAVMVHGIPTPVTGGPKRAIAIVHGIPTPATKAQKQSTGVCGPRSTPLARIGARAMRSGTMMKGPSPATSRTPISSRTRPALAKLPVNPAFVPLPPVDLAEVQALSSNCCGSEDQIVPDSDNERDPDDESHPESHDVESQGSSRGEIASIRKGLNLSRFKYS